MSERQSLYELQEQCPHPKDMTEQKYLELDDPVILDYEYCGKCGKKLGEEEQS
ncbi:hypothetical protein [Paenibacillus polymyxa]|uniref:hypothetical protein n=1 Tax=Paenibacillus polymyxa TaxID=1406 RepID=UPI001319F4D1|nr:hypothetical protein [Paenibacillus polymyxa]